MADKKYTSMDEVDSKIIRVSESYVREAAEAKKSRMDKNKENFDVYHLNQDFSHKDEGQSQEFLPRQSMGVEQIAAFIHQGLLESGEWFKVDLNPGVVNPVINANEAQMITNRQLEKAGFSQMVHDSLKLGQLGSLMIVKVHGKRVPTPRYFVKEEFDSANKKIKKQLMLDEKDIWQLNFSLIRHEDFYPDPTGRGLYIGQQIEMDISDLYALAEGENAIYDMKVIDDLGGNFDGEDEDQKNNKARETGQNVTISRFRKRVKLVEFWGTIIDPDTGKVLHKNVTWTVANDRWLIQKPSPKDRKSVV